MKKKIVGRLGLFGLMLACVSSLASCDRHEHEFGEDWKSDEDYHWHECDCGEKENNAQIPHTFDDGVIESAPNNNVPGKKKFTCTVCAFSKTGTYIEVPSKPLNFGGAPGDAELTLAWDAPSYNGGSAVIRYEVHDGSSWTSTENKSITLGGLQNFQALTFKVRAVNAAGAGEESDSLTLTPLPLAEKPSKVKNLAAVESSGQVVLSWEAPESNGNRQIVLYEVRVNEGMWDEADSDTGHTITGLTNGTEYTFNVRAVNTELEGEVESIKAIPAAVPSAPVLDEALLVRTTGNITWGWSAPENNGGSAIIRYETKFNDEAWESVGTNLSVTYNNVENGVNHALKVRAVNRMGEGAVLEYSQIVYEAPSAPQGLRVAEKDREITLYFKRAANHVAAGATYHYRIGLWSWFSMPETQYNETTGEYQYTFTALANGTQYTLDVRAVTHKDWTPVVFSDIVTINGTPGAVPGAVDYNSITVDTSTLAGVAIVSWPQPSTNGRPITGYQIALNDDRDNPISVGNVLTYNLEGLGAKSHLLQIRAINAMGAGAWSDFVQFSIAA